MDLPKELSWESRKSVNVFRNQNFLTVTYAIKIAYIILKGYSVYTFLISSRKHNCGYSHDVPYGRA